MKLNKNELQRIDNSIRILEIIKTKECETMLSVDKKTLNNIKKVLDLSFNMEIMTFLNDKKKLNKKEIERIDNAIFILERIKPGKVSWVDSGMMNGMIRELGLDFYGCKKRDVKEFVKDKEQHIIEYHNTKTTGFGRRIASYFYFPFQIKEKLQGK
jgi:hypothetical protein